MKGNPTLGSNPRHAPRHAKIAGRMTPPKQSPEPSAQEIEKAFREALRRDAIDAAHFFGLAALYEERGKQQQAVECLEIARQKGVANPFVHKLQGKIHFRRKNFKEAAEELRRARRYNPFDRETAEILGRAEYECEHYRKALEATIDAFLLVSDGDRENAERLKKRIRTFKAIRKISGQEMVELFRERRDKLQTAFDRLEWQRSRLLRREAPSTPEMTTTPTPAPVPPGGQLKLAGRLRRLDMWSGLDDDQVYLLSGAACEEFHPKGTRIFSYGSKNADIYTLEQGKIAIRRPTPYGTYNLGTLPPGTVFGEVNFISHSERSGDAVAVEDSRLLRIDARELRQLIREKPDLGVRIYWIFWHGLAHKLRGANEQLQSFFPPESASENFIKPQAEDQLAGDDVEGSMDDTIQLLKEQGLTGAELSTLTRLSNVKRYPEEGFLFHEGDVGREMYVILEGQVMISKFIAGGGEEALALLRRGDFFGEMSLIDGAPRSADARAFGGELTVVAFDNSTLTEVMAMDPVAALEFLRLLCRLICKRLREIDDKVTGWRIMAGDRSGGDGRAEGFVELEQPWSKKTPAGEPPAGKPAASTTS